MGDDYGRVEGRLYGLGGRPDSPPARAVLAHGTRSSPGPRDPVGLIASRVDLSIAVGQLSAEERSVVREHYIEGSVTHSGAVRRRVITHLQRILEAS